MTTIENRSARVSNVAVFGAEAEAARMLIAMDELGADAAASRREATERRFEASEDALEHAAEEARRTMWAGIVVSSTEIASGALGATNALTGASSGDANADTTSESGGTSGGRGFLATSLDDVGSLGGALLGAHEARAGNERQGAELVAKREEARADAAAELARREETVRDGLLRTLESVMEARHSADERAAGSPR